MIGIGLHVALTGLVVGPVTPGVLTRSTACARTGVVLQFGFKGLWDKEDGNAIAESVSNSPFGSFLDGVKKRDAEAKAKAKEEEKPAGPTPEQIAYAKKVAAEQAAKGVEVAAEVKAVAEADE